MHMISVPDSPSFLACVEKIGEPGDEAKACADVYQVLPLFNVKHLNAENGPGDEASVVSALD